VGRALNIWRKLLMLAVQMPYGFIAAWRERADVYHAHDFETLPCLWLAARLHGARLVYDAHELSADRQTHRVAGKLIAAVEGVLARRADAMITTTKMRAEHFVRHYSVAPPIVLQNRPRYYAARRGDLLRRQLDLPADGRPIVLYQGVLFSGRGLELLLDAAAQLPDAYFVILGSGKIEHAIDQRILDLGLAARVFRLPAVPFAELFAYTVSADIGVHLLQNSCLNHYTTDSNKLFEYMMAGLAVVMPDFPEIRRIVDAEGIGVLVDSASLADVVKGIRSLVEDPALLAACRARSLAAAQRYTWEAQEQALVQEYRRLLTTANGIT
jgi:glycosyltransferase involved in cell wall biosynthesis